MRKFLYRLGVVFAVLLVGGGIGLFFLTRSISALNAESQVFVDEAVVAITTNWSSQELMRRSSPAFRSVTTPEQLDGLFDAAKASLGPLATYEGATGGSKLGASTSAGMTQSAAYVARAKYRNGEAFLDIQLVKVDGTWAVQGFKINSDLLMSYMTSRKS